MLLVRLLPDFCIDAEVKFVIVSRSRETSVNVMEGSHLGEDLKLAATGWYGQNAIIVYTYKASS
jgi:hypothetical protein